MNKKLVALNLVWILVAAGAFALGRYDSGSGKTAASSESGNRFQGLLASRSDSSDGEKNELSEAASSEDALLEGLQLTLNPKAAWPRWKPVDGDTRTNPGGLYAQTPTGASLGFVDDSNDGQIAVTVSGGAVAGGALTAWARYTCCPPDFQPDRRPFASLADDLADLDRRDEVLDPDFVSGANWAETELEVADLMQRVRETMEASNLDHQNLRSQLANAGVPGWGNAIPFTPEPPRPGHPLPLTMSGRAHHARFLAYQVFKQRLAATPEIFRDRIRKPTAEPTPYDAKMPAVMRGSDAGPMTITQRQYDLLAAWLEQARKTAPSGGNGIQLIHLR